MAAQGVNPARRAGGAQIIPRPETWRYGDRPPWADVADGSQPIPTAAALDAVARLGGPHPMEPLPEARPSAVLIALLDGPHGAEVLLTRRGWHLSNHKGEISFPGGRMDPGETPTDTALREAFEEVQLDPALVEVHGELSHLSTVVSKSYIVPVVGRLRERPELRAGTSEVDRILFVPLAELTRADTYRQEIWQHYQGEWPISFFELDDETIWGATGRMLAQLLTITLLAEAAHRPARDPQP
jgi:8-oxo-dGTP pyrophosphatase MutT (NUDIX family)